MSGGHQEMGSISKIQGDGMAGAAELLQTQTGLWNRIFNYLDCASLKCAVELRIPAAMHNHGCPISLPELSAAIGVPSTRLPQLRRLMRQLTHSAVFSAVPRTVDEVESVYYALTPLSRLLADEAEGEGMSTFLLAMLDSVFVAPSQFMGAWFRGDHDSPTPFAMAHGCSLWDKASQSPEFNKMFNAGMASNSRFLMDVLIKGSGGDIFRMLRSLVDVGGGTGSTARAIADAFPELECSVLELPHVVDIAPKDGTVRFIAGDMFQFIPPADAILLKWIMHDWSDKNCVKILQRCKEAIPTREGGGKVIIIDTVVGTKNSHLKSKETQLLWDMQMMVVTGGKEREEHEWRKIFTEAGFTDYKITPLDLRSIIELYP